MLSDRHADLYREVRRKTETVAYRTLTRRLPVFT
jgi:hypothetical protein